MPKPDDLITPEQSEERVENAQQALDDAIQNYSNNPTPETQKNMGEAAQTLRDVTVEDRAINEGSLISADRRYLLG